METILVFETTNGREVGIVTSKIIAIEKIGETECFIHTSEGNTWRVKGKFERIMAFMGGAREGDTKSGDMRPK